MKSIRVFVSSAFLDMHAERDYLNRIVFPELRSRCLRLGAEFVGIDLRWGLTEEDTKHRGALKSPTGDEPVNCEIDDLADLISVVRFTAQNALDSADLNDGRDAVWAAATLGELKLPGGGCGSATLHCQATL